jgi:hypothetical protein
MASKFGSLLMPTLTTLITCGCTPGRSKANPENKSKVWQWYRILCLPCLELEEEWQQTTSSHAAIWQSSSSLRSSHLLEFWSGISPTSQRCSYGGNEEKCSHHSLGFVATWPWHVMFQRKTPRLFFFHLNTITNHASVKARPSNQTLFHTIVQHRMV